MSDPHAGGIRHAIPADEQTATHSRQIRASTARRVGAQITDREKFNAAWRASSRRHARAVLFRWILVGAAIGAAASCLLFLRP